MNALFLKSGYAIPSQPYWFPYLIQALHSLQERKRLQYIAAKDPYNFASNELSQEHAEGQGVLYWALIRHTYLKGINSLSLRQVCTVYINYHKYFFLRAWMSPH